MMTIMTTPFLATAVQIGNELLSRAFWDQDRRMCNFVGITCSEFSSTSSNFGQCKALGPDLYSGLSGISVFFAELFAHTGDAEFREAAVASLRCARHQLVISSRGSHLSAIGFHTGLVGIAFACYVVQLRTGADEPFDWLRELLATIAHRLSERHSPDVISGIAGAIPALIVLGHHPHCEIARLWSFVLGDTLIQSACRHEGFWTWGSSSDVENPNPRPLTGYAHGAAGIGLALLELFAVTQEERFLAAGRNALSYEATQYDRSAKNWPDHRTRASPEPMTQGPTFSVTWCHGAPGIALSRLRAMRIDVELRARYYSEAINGAETTCAVLAERLGQPGLDVSPCHGLSGLIEVVLTAGDVLDQPRFTCQAYSAAEELIARYAHQVYWPSGVVGGGPNPSFMLGVAGVGYHFLRLHAPHTVRPFLTSSCGWNCPPPSEACQ
jgi:lantibiotic modifying enzyme